MYYQYIYSSIIIQNNPSFFHVKGVKTKRTDPLKLDFQGLTLGGQFKIVLTPYPIYNDFPNRIYAWWRRKTSNPFPLKINFLNQK